ncbi:MAG: type II toxin-antitoxin system RelE/ParE family toxin [Syntrophobacteraceae bacterium]|nr:type II toxin-antitoxin system RelE/ParE family toxin [Syntrophobacteraceae bacterium]
MKVHWTRNAIDHLVGIYEHIAINSPLYAKGLIDKLTRRSEQIADYSFSGRKVPQYDAEDIPEIIEAPYRIIYRIKQDQIDVIAVVHCARSLPDDPVQEDFH